ncbi:peptidylprolyl isomerase [Buchnera aphidicola (Uroleucon sonchi)]|uniref:Peptidylprolyl isomerase n=2 Tax=Buchnera aphidicola TaxID=9 RepID=A0A6C1FAG6_BUCUN|nr:peptidylprolyl isomerase [Buchnera aphidicola (Uroleucon sonchi)]
MKFFIFIIIYIFGSMFHVSAKTYVVDKIVAIVNDQIILDSDVNQILSFLKKDNNVNQLLKKSFLKENIIQKLIINSLILQEANKINIVVTKEQINNIIKKIALKKNISVAELKKHIISYNKENHHYYDYYIKNIEELLKIKIIENYELNKRINISEAEINEMLKKLIQSHNQLQKINFSYIFLPTSKKYSNQKNHHIKTIVKRIKDKIQQGHSFEKLLVDLKEDKNILVKKMLWMSLFDIHHQLSHKLNITKKGEILGPILGSKGFYILKIHDINKNEKHIVTEFHIQHCLIKSSSLNDSENKKRILNIYENIQKGMYSFDYAVKHFSDDSDISDKTGDLGWVSKELLHTNFNKLELKFNKNHISKPIKSHFGWHIFKLLDTRQVNQFYNFKKQQAYRILLTHKKILAKQEWIRDLKKISYIKIIKSS